jgi:hypothetical protein
MHIRFAAFTCDIRFSRKARSVHLPPTNETCLAMPFFPANKVYHSPLLVDNISSPSAEIRVTTSADTPRLFLPLAMFSIALVTSLEPAAIFSVAAVFSSTTADTLSMAATSWLVKAPIFPVAAAISSPESRLLSEDRFERWLHHIQEVNTWE